VMILLIGGDSFSATFSCGPTTIVHSVLFSGLYCVLCFALFVCDEMKCQPSLAVRKGLVKKVFVM